MSEKPKDHGEPPSFAKWLIWLFRKDTWTKQPLIAAVATIISVSVAASGVYGVYKLLPKPVPPPTPEVVTSPEIADVRFIESEQRSLEDGTTYEEDVLKLRVFLHNRMQETAVFMAARFDIQKIWKVHPLLSTAAVIEVTGEYVVRFDLENASGTAECDLDWFLSPDKAEAIDFVLVSPEGTHSDYVFLCQLTLLYGAEGKEIRTAEPFLIALCRSNSFWKFDEPLDESFFYNTAFDEQTLARRRTYCTENKKVVAELREYDALKRTSRLAKMIEVIDSAVTDPPGQ